MIHYQAAIAFVAEIQQKITGWDVGMKNIILPLCPLWFIESLITGEKQKSKKKFLQIKKMFLPLQPLKKTESVLYRFGNGRSDQENKFLFIFCKLKKRF